MKKLIAVLALVLMATPALALSIANSKHNLSSQSGNTIANDTSDEICVFCHTPHNANTSSIAPLWNRTNPTGTITPYGDPANTFDGGAITLATSDAPLCLSCHDGASFNDALKNEPNSATTAWTATWDNGDSNLAMDLTNDHPVGFSYDTSDGVDTEIEAIASVGDGTWFFGSNNAMWCSSCHDVHDNEFSPFLRADNSGSGLCLECHIK